MKALVRLVADCNNGVSMTREDSTTDLQPVDFYNALNKQFEGEITGFFNLQSDDLDVFLMILDEYGIKGAASREEYKDYFA